MPPILTFFFKWQLGQFGSWLVKNSDVWVMTFMSLLLNFFTLTLLWIIVNRNYIDCGIHVSLSLSSLLHPSDVVLQVVAWTFLFTVTDCGFCFQFLSCFHFSPFWYEEVLKCRQFPCQGKHTSMQLITAHGTGAHFHPGCCRKLRTIYFPDTILAPLAWPVNVKFAGVLIFSSQWAEIYNLYSCGNPSFNLSGLTYCCWSYNNITSLYNFWDEESNVFIIFRSSKTCFIN